MSTANPAANPVSVARLSEIANRRSIYDLMALPGKSLNLGVPKFVE